MIMYMTLKPESVCVLSIHDNVYDPEARISLCVCVSLCCLYVSRLETLALESVCLSLCCLYVSRLETLALESVCVCVCVLSIHDNVYDPEARISLSWINWPPLDKLAIQYEGLSSSARIPLHK